MLEYIPTNREKKLSPKLGKHWCNNCDRNLVSNGGKCSLCRKKDLKRRFKK